MNSNSRSHIIFRLGVPFVLDVGGNRMHTHMTTPTYLHTPAGVQSTISGTSTSTSSGR